MRTARSCSVIFVFIFYFNQVMLCLKTKFHFQQVLLQSDLIKSSSEERPLLKNLGNWLGKFTIGRNQTLRAKEIDPKILIVEVCALILISFLFPHHSVILCHVHNITCTCCCQLLHNLQISEFFYFLCISCCSLHLESLLNAELMVF